ncbi:Protein of unknown function [Pyronema omphalodes CBS 100304]|uniref:Uncharacterized protein n=1 Tax=Pyronema omphalodes (strain CBS 100304) TaxID=1076935 RepID=U4LAB9_PYROM|nr:Protein of unknown function [Pyronema omphalodes CBS 100304]
MKFSILPFSLSFIFPSIVNGDELGMKIWMTTKAREAKAMKWTIWEDRCKPISEPMDNSITFVRPSSNTCCTFYKADK